MLKKISNEQIIDEIRKRGTASLILDRIPTNDIINYLATRDNIEEQTFTNVNWRMFSYIPGYDDDISDEDKIVLKFDKI